MRKNTWNACAFGALVLFMALPAVLPATEQDASPSSEGYLTDDERAEAVALLEGTKDDLLERVADLSDKAFHYKPGPDRWSIAQILEHLVIVEGQVMGGAEATLAAEPNSQWESETASQTDRLYQLVPLRVRRFQAPESVQPKGTTGRQELVRRFEELRAKAVELVSDASKPIQAYTSEHPVLGPLNAHQWILFTGLHNYRHNQQLVEVMADPGFPH